MIVCGASISGADAILLWIDSEGLQPIRGQKVHLQDGYDQIDVAKTAELFRQLFAENGTERIVVRKSSTSGQYPAGHMAFRVETLLVLSATCQVSFVSAQAVGAYLKKHVHEMPDGVKKYQQDAYNAVVVGLA